MDIYKEVTDRIIAQMEQGIIPWQKPWQNGTAAAISHATGKRYSLLNQMLLGRAGEYLTFNECRKAGGFIRKGEKAHMVVFWKFLDQKDEETGEVKQIPFLRYYNVFHIDQCEGVAAKYAQPLPESADADQTAETIICHYCGRFGVKMEHQQGDQAFYQPSSDRIVLPLLKQFAATAEYYSTAFHEMVHSTGHASRLNRLEKTAFFGSDAYSKEELVAEIGASALVHHVGLETAKSFHNNAAYIQNWLTVLRNDRKFIVSAAGKADKAVSLILGE